MGFFTNILNSVKKSTRSRFNLHKETSTIELLLDTKDENYFTLEFDSIDVENLYDPSVQNGYKIIGDHESLGELYIEAIQLRHDQEWNVSAGSAFDIFIKESFRDQDLVFIDSYHKDFIKFSKYQINFETHIGVIWFSLNSYEVFIIDPKGKLFNDLLEIYGVKKKDLVIEDTDREIGLDIYGSLTAMNIREDFFSKEN